MSAGAFNCRGVLQRPGSGEDSLGQPVSTWLDVGHAWARILTMNGLSIIRAGAKTSVMQASVRFRYREDVQPGWRFVYKSSFYCVKAVSPDLVKKRHVDLICEVTQ